MYDLDKKKRKYEKCVVVKLFKNFIILRQIRQSYRVIDETKTNQAKPQLL